MAKTAKTKAEPLKPRLFEREYNKHWKPEEIDALADVMFEWFEADPKRYWLKSFCIEAKVRPQAISEFAGKSEYFSFVLDLCKARQEERLLANGMQRDKGQAMPVFALKNVAGWRDQVDGDSDITSQIRELFALFAGQMVSTAGAGRTEQEDTKVSE